MLAQKGFTLVELMVSLAISSILLIALVMMYMSSVQHGSQIMNANRLYQQLNETVVLIGDDVRRAGYWGASINDVGRGTNTNPFMTGTTNISVNASQNCVLFTYDRDANGAISAIGSGTDDEHYGYRLSGNTIQLRPSGASFSCTASSTAWENITDPNVVKVTALTFTLTQKSLPLNGSSPTGALIVRYFDISVTGQLASDPTVSMTLSDHIRIRNDQYIP